MCGTGVGQVRSWESAEQPILAGGRGLGQGKEVNLEIWGGDLGRPRAVNLEIRGGDLGRPRATILGEARDAELSENPQESGRLWVLLGPLFGNPEMSVEHPLAAAAGGGQKKPLGTPDDHTSRANWYRRNGALWRTRKGTRRPALATAPAKKHFLTSQVRTPIMLRIFGEL